MCWFSFELINPMDGKAQSQVSFFDRIQITFEFPISNLKLEKSNGFGFVSQSSASIQSNSPDSYSSSIDEWMIFQTCIMRGVQDVCRL
jgi:hypothetical protein